MENIAGTAALNWSETMEDLVDSDEFDEAISYLEFVVSNLEKQVEKEESSKKEIGESSSFATQEFSTALQELSKLYSVKGLSAKADQMGHRAAQIKNSNRSSCENDSILDEFSETQATDASRAEIDRHGDDGKSSIVQNDSIPEESSIDDWETTADRAPEEFLSPLFKPKVSKPSLKDEISETHKRRGRGPFVNGLYSDNLPEKHLDDTEDSSEILAEDMGRRISIHGTNHVPVLSGLPLSIRRTDLERLLDKFRNRFLVRWVNETTSLAVFRTPADAAEACNTIQFPLSVRILTEEELFNSIPSKDMEPPRQRPQTSARTAQRMIAHGMGIRLPSTFGSTELQKQELERRSSIVSRRNLKDDAWGDDSPFILLVEIEQQANGCHFFQLLDFTKIRNQLNWTFVVETQF